jgi:hypothetical protein
MVKAKEIRQRSLERVQEVVHASLGLHHGNQNDVKELFYLDAAISHYYPNCALFY